MDGRRSNKIVSGNPGAGISPWLACVHSGCTRKVRPEASADHDCCGGGSRHAAEHAMMARGPVEPDPAERYGAAASVVLPALVVGAAWLAWRAVRGITGR